MKNIVLPEIVSVGIYNTQNAIKNRVVSQNRKTTMFELELAIDDGGISYIDNLSHPIQKDLIICAKSGQIRHTRLPFKCYFIHMIVNEGELFDMLSSLPNYIMHDDIDEIRDIFISICEHYGTEAFKNEIMLQSLILKLIYMLDKLAPALKYKHKPKHNNSEVIEQTLKYINGNLTSDLSLNTLSERSNFSPVYFHKLFKASTGKNLREYVEEQRIKKSIELLISTEMTLTQIAYECGFSSQSYFSYAFKRHMGTTPREYARGIYMKYER